MKNAFFYFFIFPFLGFLSAIRNYRSNWAKPTIIAFVAFFGFSMIKADFSDSSRYVQNLENMYYGEKDFDTLKSSFFNESDGQIDIYAPIVIYVFSLFTNNGNLLYLFFGFVFGYFYVNNIWLLLNLSKGKLPWEKFLLISAFSLIIGFWSVNGVRMWTAAHIFFYGGFLYLYYQKRKGLFIAVASVLVHFSFILPVFILLFYSLFKFNYKFFYLLFVASFFILELNIESIRIVLENYAPIFLQSKVKSYLGESYIEGIQDQLQNANWYILYYLKSLSYFNVIFVSILFFKTKPDYVTKKLFGFSLLLLAVGNITSLLPSGSRFLLVAFLFSIASCFIILVKNPDLFAVRSLKFLSPILLFFCIVSIRTSFDFFNVTTLTNPFVVLFSDVEIPLISIFK